MSRHFFQNESPGIIYEFKGVMQIGLILDVTCIP